MIVLVYYILLTTFNFLPKLVLRMKVGARFLLQKKSVKNKNKLIILNIFFASLRI